MLRPSNPATSSSLTPNIVFKSLPRWTALAALFVSLVAVNAADSQSAAKPTSSADTLVARGKGVEIKRSRLDESFIAFKAQAATEGREVPKDKLPEAEATLLDRLIVVQLLNNLATDAEKTAARERMEKMFSDLRAKARTQSVFDAQLQAAGLTAEELKVRIVEQAVSEAVVSREVGSKVEVPAEAVKKFYDENPKYFERPERVRASHVLIGTIDPATQQDVPEERKKEKRATAEKVRERAKKGEDFAALAKEFSDDPGSKDNGGEYTFPRGQMVKPFEEAAFSLKPGEISDLVTTQFGYHVIKLSEKLPAGMEPFEKVQENIKTYLVQEELKKRVPDYYAKIKKDAGVEVLDPALVLPKS